MPQTSRTTREARAAFRQAITGHGDTRTGVRLSPEAVEAIGRWRQECSDLPTLAERLYLSTDPGCPVRAAAQRVLLAALGEPLKDQGVDLVEHLDRARGAGLGVALRKDGGGKGRGRLNGGGVLDGLKIHGSVPCKGGSDKSAPGGEIPGGRRLSTKLGKQRKAQS